MTPLQVFAFFVMPVVVVAFAFLVYFAETRRWRKLKPAANLFDDKHSVRTPGE